jgi:cytoskeletal protein CcmA (bactofilin family)
MFTRDDKNRRVEDKVEPVESVVALETTLQGSLRSAYGIRIMGAVEGDIESGGRVRIDKGGRIRGSVKASDIIVNGELNGNIDASGHVELGHESRMVGNIKAARMAIAEGSFFQGEVKMPRPGDQPVRFVEKRLSEPPGSSPPNTDTALKT